MKIIAHMLIKNEARYIWYSLMSIIKHVDKILLWDDGSDDGTVEIIEEILKIPLGKEKIEFKKLSQDTDFREDLKRQQMLDATNGDWILMIDGDEIWWEDSIKKVISEINKNGHKVESIVVPTINLVGDIYHYQEPKAGKFKFAGKVGHLNLRGINTKIPGLKSSGRDWDWGWIDANGALIQDRNPEKVLFIDAPYLHASYLQRAGKSDADSQVFRRNFKKKYEIGESFPKDFFYPEALFLLKPRVVPSPWKKMDSNFFFRAILETPFRKIKRRLI